MFASILEVQGTKAHRHAQQGIHHNNINNNNKSNDVTLKEVVVLLTRIQSCILLQVLFKADRYRGVHPKPPAYSHVSTLRLPSSEGMLQRPEEKADLRVMKGIHCLMKAFAIMVR